MTRLDKTNRENRIASFAVGAIANGLTEIGGVRVTNVRFTDKGFSVDLEDGSTVACRITAHAPEVAQ